MEQYTLFSQSQDSRSIAVSEGAEAVAIRNASDGSLRYTLRLFPSDDGTTLAGWVAFTPEGYYDGSPGVERFLRWRVGDASLPADRYAATYHRPDLLRKALAGK